MALRRPAAQPRRASGWRRSGDDTCWENMIAEEQVLPRVSQPPRRPRPQSAIEGGQLDRWLEHLQRMQTDLLRAPVHDQVPAFNDQTTSMPALHRGTSGHVWRQQRTPSFSRGSSSCGSPSFCESSFGSQESLQSGFFSPPERRGSWERAHIIHTPTKEQAQVSHFAPVKTGWLPIQRRVVVAEPCSQRQLLDHSAGQVKLKQPITPTIQSAANRHHDEEVERSRTAPSHLGVQTWRKPDQDSPVSKQVPEKLFLANEGDRPVGWQALRRGWNTNRVSAFPGGSQSNELSTRTSSDPNRKSPLMKTTSIDPLKHTLQPPASADPYKPRTVLQETNSTETHKSYTPLQRTSNIQPIRATAQLCRTNSSSQPSYAQTSSAVETIAPRNKASFSSITISSKKVSRSASLPGSGNCSPSSPSSESSFPLQAHQPMDPNSRQFTVQRKATIVKVTEQRVTSGPVQSSESTRTQPAVDTVVHRRKATIIKVTEHRESYSPAKVSGPRHPEYRHSYTDGVHKENSMWGQGNHSQAPSYRALDFTKTPNCSPGLERNGGTLHRSTLSLTVSTPPAIAAAPNPSEVPLRAVGRRWDRLHRPLSCYGNVFGHTEPSKENVSQPAARKWSFELPRETAINPMHSGSGFINSPTGVKETGQLLADTLEPNGVKKGRAPPETVESSASPSLTLIQAPDPHSNQTPEEVLALNAAAIIANIKLQRQLSKKKTPNAKSEKDSAAAPKGNSVTDEGRCAKPNPDQSPVRRQSRPHAAFVPLGPDPERPPETLSLQEALRRSRPDFISRSQCRVRELERRKHQRRELAGSVDVAQSRDAPRKGGVRGVRPASHNDNLFKTRDRAIIRKEMQPRSKRTPAEVKRNKEEEKKKEACLTNRQKVMLFKKRLVEQILQRNNS